MSIGEINAEPQFDLTITLRDRLPHRVPRSGCLSLPEVLHAHRKSRLSGSSCGWKMYFLSKMKVVKKKRSYEKKYWGLQCLGTR